MIRFSLKCSEGHRFESWFASAEAFDNLAGASMLSCPVCGGSEVEKAMMAPRVTTARKKAAPKAEAPEAQPPKPGALSQPMSEPERKLAELRAHVEKNSDYVGMSFAAEARKIHEGETPARAIYGEAKPEEAKKLIEDGVPVAPLPFIPQRKTN